MGDIIVLEKSKKLRENARASLKGRWKETLFVAFAIIVLMTALPLIVASVINAFDTSQLIGSIFQTAYLLIFTGPLLLSFNILALKLSRNQELESGQTFAGFDNFWKTVGLYLYMLLFITLWSLLFIVPGIIAAIRYSMSYYIMKDNPDMSISQCVNESKKMMKGNAGKFFAMIMSFAGWIVLLIATFVVIVFLIELLYMHVSPIGYLRYEAVALYGNMTIVQPNIMDYLEVAIICVMYTPLYMYIKVATSEFYELLTEHKAGQIYKFEKKEVEAQ